MLDTVLSLFLIAKGSSLTVHEHRLQHKVLTHDNVEIRVFGCDFSKWICMHTVTRPLLQRRLKPDIIAADEQWWCPAHIASQQTSTEEGHGCHYIVIKSNLALQQSTSSDSLSDNGSFEGSIRWLGDKISKIPDLLVESSKAPPPPAWGFPLSPEQNHVEQANSSDCGLHVIGDLAETLFGIPLSLRTVTRLRQNLPTLLIAFYLNQRGHSLQPALHLEEIMGYSHSLYLLLPLPLFPLTPSPFFCPGTPCRCPRILVTMHDRVPPLLSSAWTSPPTPPRRDPFDRLPPHGAPSHNLP